MISYATIYKNAQKFEENELFTQYINEALSEMYDANFMKLHFSPQVIEFQQLENYQMDFHKDIGQTFIKFAWPDNQGVYPDTFQYLSEQNYGLSRTELLAIDPPAFTGVVKNSKIKVELLTSKTLEAYKTLNYDEEMTHGEVFAKQKQAFYDTLLDHLFIKPLVALLDGKVVGLLDQIVSPDTIEIDNVFVSDDSRGQGVATALQQYVMNKAQNKTVILLVDSEDTPIEMYKKQGYQSQAFEITVQKEIE